MFKAMPRAATRESRPTIKPRPPKNSAAIARIANNAGICIVFVKKPMVPLKPSPPNQPNIFCAPCAKNTTPSANRRIAVAASFSVEMSFRNIVPPVLSLLLYAPFHEDCCRSPRSAGGNREHREAAPKAEAPGIHASRRSDRSAWLRRRSAAPRSRPTTFVDGTVATSRYIFFSELAVSATAERSAHEGPPRPQAPRSRTFPPAARGRRLARGRPRPGSQAPEAEARFGRHTRLCAESAEVGAGGFSRAAPLAGAVGPPLGGRRREPRRRQADGALSEELAGDRRLRRTPRRNVPLRREGARPPGRRGGGPPRGDRGAGFRRSRAAEPRLRGGPLADVGRLARRPRLLRRRRRGLLQPERLPLVRRDGAFDGRSRLRRSPRPGEGSGPETRPADSPGADGGHPEVTVGVGAQWELPGAVARRHQRHVFGFFPIPVRTRAFCRYGGLGSSNRPFPRRRPRSNGSAREPSGRDVAGGGETAFEPHRVCAPLSP